MQLLLPTFLEARRRQRREQRRRRRRRRQRKRRRRKRRRRRKNPPPSSSSYLVRRLSVQLSKFQTLAQAGSEDEEDDEVVDKQSFLTMNFKCLRDDLTATVYHVPESITAGQAMMMIDNLILGWKCKLIVNGKVWANAGNCVYQAKIRQHSLQTVLHV
jgi:hypothetical protein